MQNLHHDVLRRSRSAPGVVNTAHLGACSVKEANGAEAASAWDGWVADAAS